jgi:transcriptional regulator with XRE-family HTH domain
MYSFAKHLKELMDQAGLSPTAFAGAAGAALSTICPTLEGQRPAPKSRETLDRWADALGLTGDARARFRILADLSRAPESIQRLVAARRLVGEDEVSYDPHISPFCEYLAALLDAHRIDKRPYQSILSGESMPTADDAQRIARACDLAASDAAELVTMISSAYLPAEEITAVRKAITWLANQARRAAMARQALGKA